MKAVSYVWRCVFKKFRQKATYMERFLSDANNNNDIFKVRFEN